MRDAGMSLPANSVLTNNLANRPNKKKKGLTDWRRREGGREVELAPVIGLYYILTVDVYIINPPALKLSCRYSTPFTPGQFFPDNR